SRSRWSSARRRTCGGTSAPKRSHSHVAFGGTTRRSSAHDDGVRKGLPWGKGVWGKTPRRGLPPAGPQGDITGPSARLGEPLRRLLQDPFSKRAAALATDALPLSSFTGTSAPPR